MASGKDYLDFILEQLSLLDDISYKPMMGEYILYYQDRIFGGIYDNRFLVKPTASARVIAGHAIFVFISNIPKPRFLINKNRGSLTD